MSFLISRFSLRVDTGRRAQLWRSHVSLPVFMLPGYAKPVGGLAVVLIVWGKSRASCGRLWM
jgi:hypothetical protein